MAPMATTTSQKLSATQMDSARNNQKQAKQSPGSSKRANISQGIVASTTTTTTEVAQQVSSENSLAVGNNAQCLGHKQQLFRTRSFSPMSLQSATNAKLAKQQLKIKEQQRQISSGHPNCSQEDNRRKQRKRHQYRLASTIDDENRVTDSNNSSTSTQSSNLIRHDTVAGVASSSATSSSKANSTANQQQQRVGVGETCNSSFIDSVRSKLLHTIQKSAPFQFKSQQQQQQSQRKEHESLVRLLSVAAQAQGQEASQANRRLPHQRLSPSSSSSTRDQSQRTSLASTSSAPSSYSDQSVVVDIDNLVDEPQFGARPNSRPLSSDFNLPPPSSSAGISTLRHSPRTSSTSNSDIGHTFQPGSSWPASDTQQFDRFKRGSQSFNQGVLANVVVFELANGMREFTSRKNNRNKISDHCRAKMHQPSSAQSSSTAAIASASSASMSSLSSTGSVNQKPFCKICHVGEPEQQPSSLTIMQDRNGIFKSKPEQQTSLADKLISPCRCSGTMQYIHCGCLLKWIEISDRHNDKPISCELCGHVYTWHRRFNYFNIKFPNSCAKDVLLHTVFIFAILMMIACAFIPIYHGRGLISNPTTVHYSNQHHHNDHSEAIHGHQQDMSNDGPKITRHVSPKLGKVEKLTLLSVAGFFFSFFVAIYAVTRANYSICEMISKFIRMNQTFYITEYDHSSRKSQAKLVGKSSSDQNHNRSTNGNRKSSFFQINSG